MEKCKYLVISELDKFGFIFGILNSLAEAKIIVDKIFNSSHQLTYDETQLIHKTKCIATYEIKGNQIHNGKSEYGHFDGFYSVAVIKVTSDANSIMTYINERANYSWVFEIDDYEEEFDRLAELFPSLNIGAN